MEAQPGVTESVSSGEHGGAEALTATEIDILNLIASGQNTSQIARAKGRSVHTIRTHLRNITVKLDVRGGRSRLLARARQLGLIVVIGP